MEDTVNRLSNEKCFWFMYISINKAYSIIEEQNLHMFLTAITLYKNYFDVDITPITRRSSTYTQINLLKDAYKNKFTENDIYLFQVLIEYMEQEKCYEKIEVKTSEIVISEVIKKMGEEIYIKEVLLCL